MNQVICESLLLEVDEYSQRKRKSDAVMYKVSETLISDLLSPGLYQSYRDKTMIRIHFLELLYAYSF